MPPTDEHINYTTQWVTIPLITASDNAATLPQAVSPTHRRSSLPTHLGPWPLKRSLSEDDCVRITPVAPPSTDHSTAVKVHPGDHRPSLASVLARIDEECQTVDRALKIEAALRSGFTGADDRVSRKQADGNADVNQKLGNALMIILAASAVCIFISAPVLTAAFAPAVKGKIMLPAEAAPKSIFGLLLGVLAMAVGMVIAIAFAALLAVCKGWKLLAIRNAVTTGATTAVAGSALTAWVLVWVLPIVSHA
ncbi:uncharacterized protein HMPREF1541_05505 [Cyphellophora europaea CBS 101466]|uniref:Uncharacterized protein n=1 Tax=Cyphellophora europaea (strain CBS 101466) TaxID=1220924 RepID=W2RS51_CYPE1|nr:uncharacterized protein HMPREF1541_05505 [Cyphellophora europaea CBS 101466]ETN39282.1 hypothetical protein HMPREF1541_05505 [Cyphellophora europaea CBS 101466]